MNQCLRTFSLLVTTIWVGGLIWIGLVFAPYLFGLAANNSAAVPNTAVAADLIGPLLYSSDLVGLIAVLSIGSILLILRLMVLVCQSRFRERSPTTQMAT